MRLSYVQFSDELGNVVYEFDGDTDVGERDVTTSGTWLHEFGHNLNLLHGGSDSVNYKPNYLSVMNYTFQLSGIFRASVLGCLPFVDAPPYAFPCTYDPVSPVNIDFSHEALPTLNKAALVETAGIGSNFSPYDFDISVAFPGPVSVPTFGGADWNQNGVIAGTVAVDINNSGGAVGLLTGYYDWGNLAYAFQCQTPD